MSTLFVLFVSISILIKKISDEVDTMIKEHHLSNDIFIKYGCALKRFNNENLATLFTILTFYWLGITDEFAFWFWNKC